MMRRMWHLNAGLDSTTSSVRQGRGPGFPARVEGAILAAGRLSERSGFPRASGRCGPAPLAVKVLRWYGCIRRTRRWASRFRDQSRRRSAF
jgi:hypothetical protein